MPLREKDLINFSKQAQAEKERKERLDNALEVERVIDKILKGSDADDSSYADDEHRRVTKWGREATNARAAHTRARRASPMRQRSATNQQPSQSSTARSVPSRTAHPIPQVHHPASPLRRQRSATRQSNQHAAAAAACTPSSSGHLQQQQHSHTTRGAPSSSRPLPSSQAASSPVRRQRSATRQSSTQSHKAHPHPHVVSVGEKTAPPTSARASSARGAAHNQHQAVSHHPPHSAASALACSHQDAPPTSARRSQRHQGHVSQVQQQQQHTSPVRPSSSTQAHAHPPSHAHAPKDSSNNTCPANNANNNSTGVPSAAAAPAPALTTSATTMTTVLSSAGNAPRSASTSITTRNIHASGTPTTARATNGPSTAPTHIGAPMRSPRIDACVAATHNAHNGVTMQHAATTISSPRSGGSHHGVNEAHQTASRTVQHAANNHSSSMNEARLVPANGGGNHLISATGPSGTHCQRAGVMGAMGANTPSNVPTTNVPIKKRQRVQPQSIIRTRQQRKLDAEELNVSNNMAMNDDIPNAPPLPLGKP